MEGQKRPRVFLQKRYNTQKAFPGADAGVRDDLYQCGYRSERGLCSRRNRVDFEIYGADLVEAINDAVEIPKPGDSG